jgi:hypothetical protein
VKDRIALGSPEDVYAELFTRKDGIFVVNTKGQERVSVSPKETRFSTDVSVVGTIVSGAVSVGNAVRITSDGNLLFQGSKGRDADIRLQQGKFVLRNTGGDILFHVARERGLSIAAVSGNALFSGQLSVESATDVDKAEEVPTAALNVRGGAVVRRNLMLGGSLSFMNPAGRVFTIAAPGASEGDGYLLRLPRELPPGPGQCLTCDADGQLRWKRLPRQQAEVDPTDGDEDQEVPTSSKKRTSFGQQDVTDDVVSEFQVLGRWFHIDDFVVTVVQKPGTTRRALYHVSGIRTGDRWVTEIKKVLGDDLPLAMKVLPDGRLCYTCEAIPEWSETMFSWTAPKIRNTEDTGKAVFGSDIVVTTTDQEVEEGAFVTVKNATCVRQGVVTKDWTATLFGVPTLQDSDNGDVSGTIAAASTVTIEGAPKWNVEGSTNALHVRDGTVLLQGPLMAEGGLTTNSLAVTGALSIGGGVTKCLLKGILHVGPSDLARRVFEIKFDNAMPDTAYTIVGNVVSTDPDCEDAFLCTFKSPTVSGCKVILCNMTQTGWTDVTVRVHWVAVL